MGGGGVGVGAVERGGGECTGGGGGGSFRDSLWCSVEVKGREHSAVDLQCCEFIFHSQLRSN